MSPRPASKPPGRCLALLGQLSAYIDDELTLREQKAIETHCRDCTRCQKMIASLRRTVELCRTTQAARMPARAQTLARTGVARLLRQLAAGKSRRSRS